MFYINACDSIRIPFFSEEECKQCIEYINWKEKDLRERFTESDSIDIVDESQVNTVYYDEYNFFRDNPQYVDRLSEVLYEYFPGLPRPVLVQSWTNVYKKGEGIYWHIHSGTAGQSYTANIFLGGETSPGLKIMEPGEENTTWYLKNNIGEMIVLNNDTYHSVDKNTSDKTRYSIGLTIHSFNAITPHNLSSAAINRSGSVVIIA